MNRKKITATLAISLVLALASWAAWSVLASPTRVAFVNYQAITLGQISRAAAGVRFVRICDLPPEELGRAADFDMIFVNGMGLRITETQRETLVKAAERGIPVLTTAATNPQNDITSVDSADCEYLRGYLAGGRSNYSNMLAYVRRFVDGKKLFAPMPADPASAASWLICYPTDGEELGFRSVAAFEEWRRKTGRWDSSAPRIILTGQMGTPDSLVSSLERAGCMVYPAGVIQRFIAGGHADSVAPSALINMAHGRMGDRVTAWLEKTDIPLFSPVNANRDCREWAQDKMGMSGGFLSQSIVTPEIDGAIRPFTLFAHFPGKDGLPSVEAIPGRLEEFTQMVCNHISLARKPNAEKKIAIFYFKGPGRSALTAEGMEVAPSLFNFLVRLKAEGYGVSGLPADAAALERLIAENGRVFNSYAAGAAKDFVARNHPEIVSERTYDTWAAASFSPQMRADIDAVDGAFPGHGLTDGNGNLAIARIRLGNVVLIPQTAAGIGGDSFRIVHGTDQAPPHAYVASYLWARHGFGADVLMHFGTHGSLEFTPRKQAALGSSDWPDRLVGPLPHIYLYSTSNVGEAMTAKRRSYATIVSHLTPPFLPSGLRAVCKDLADALAAYNRSETRADSLRNAGLVRRHTLALGIHRELRIDSAAPFTPDDIHRIEDYADELASEKVTGASYILGEPYSPGHILATVEAMTVDPIACGLHKLRGGSLAEWRAKALALVRSGSPVDDDALCRIAGISKAGLDSARATVMAMEGSRDMLSRMMVMGAMMPSKPGKTPRIADRPETSGKHRMIPGMSPEKAIEMAVRMGADTQAIERMKAAMAGRKMTTAAAGAETTAPAGPSPAQIDFAIAVSEVERALANIATYRRALAESPEREMASLVNALSGGFVAPASGGDPVLNPDILPTGRNMYAVNAEETPSAVAWEKGKALAESTIGMYRKAHADSFPRKVSYTLWSGEFIETEGATIAQVLYMLGVEPVRDPFGRVTDLRLIPSAELGRPRIDVVVQTSGQLRDLAASRLFLISHAVRMATGAEGDVYPNYVADGAVEAERRLVAKGVPPKEARGLSTERVFGGAGGSYGSGIQQMVEAGDRWEDEAEIASVYMANMGALYGSEEEWEQMRDHAFEAALANTDAVVQPRQSNTWGALSLDHVYEFMGGMNLAVRTVTGKDPDAYLSDYRNRGRARMQELKEAIGVESRTTILNPSYIREKMKGGAGDMAAIAETVTNTYGWNVMKPDVIDNELWDGIYETYVADAAGLGIRRHLMEVNPAAVQEMTAVMLETARKGLWQASHEQVRAIAALHTEAVARAGAACTGFVCDNAALRAFIASNVTAEAAADYNRAVAGVRAEGAGRDDGGMVMKREELTDSARTVNRIDGLAAAAAVAALFLATLVILIRRRRKPAA